MPKKRLSISKKELIELISKSQDNNCLIKEIAEDDFLSKLILKSINETDGLEDIQLDLEYAISQLTLALNVVKKNKLG